METSISHNNKILLVDDEEDIRDVLGITLEDMGYNVFTAENGKKALELFERHSFQLVLTDIKMPGMDGIELLKKIKTASPLTEIIMITGHGDMELAIESFRNQAIEFITKPVDVESLGIALKRTWEKIKIKKGLREYTENLEKLVFEKTRALDKKHAETSGETGNRKAEDVTSIMENLPLVVFSINKEFKLCSANHVFKKKFGNMTETTCYELCTRSNAPCRECPALETFQDGSTRQREITYSTPTGESIPFLAWSSPVKYNENKQVTEVIIMATDITQVIDIQDHLTSLGLMIGSVSHGIKGLLTGLDGGVYVLDSALKKKNQEQAAEGLDMVREMTSKIKRMILDILFYAKERELQREEISAKTFALDLIKIVQHKAEKHHISFEQNLPQENFTFEGDTGVLHAALINIFDNAIDACIDDTSKTNHEISFTLTKKKNAIKFIISDNGVGMDPEDIQKAFTLFHSGKGKKGTGLGLFISQKSVHHHNGTISIESKKNKGTTFVVTLPQSLNPSTSNTG